MELLQRCYIKVLSPFIPYSNKFSDRVKQISLVLGIAAISLLCCVYSVIGHDPMYHKKVLAVGSVFVLGIIFIILPSELKVLKWKWSFGIIWISFCAYLILSDLLINKQEPYLGWVLFIEFTPLFFIMQNYENREVVWKSIFKGIKLFYVLSLAFSILFRTYNPVYRYMGPFNNPNKLGMFLILVVAVYIYELDQYLKNSRSYLNLIFTVAGLTSCGYLLLISKARTSLIACLLQFLIWVIIRVFQQLNKEIIKKFCIVIFSSFAIFIVVSFSLEKALQYVPKIINHPIEYKNDVYQQRDNLLGMESVVYAKGLVDTAPKQKTISFVPATVQDNVLSNIFRKIQMIPGMYSLTNGRIGSFRLYSSKLNWFGHAKQNIISPDGIDFAHAHNNFIQIGYDYGTPAMVIFCLLTVIWGFQFIKRYYKYKTSFSVFCFVFYIGFSVGTLAEMMLNPFQYITVFVFWLLCGEVFVSEN